MYTDLPCRLSYPKRFSSHIPCHDTNMHCFSSNFATTSKLLITFALLYILIPFSSFSVVSAAATCSLRPPNSGKSATSPPTSSHSTPGSYNNGTDGCRRNGTVTQEVVITGWYPGWLASSVPPSSLSWDKWTHLTYSFAWAYFLMKSRWPQY